MRYQHVCLESFGYTLPTEIVTSAEIEARLQPLYQRLRLPEGRLELMTGIRERRFWPADLRPSSMSIVSGRRAIEAAEIDPADIGLLIHGSVCRDQLEPATACRVHHELGMPEACFAYDVSNACLGLLNGIVQAADKIELGQIKAALVVGTENGRELVDSTIAYLNQATHLTRNTIKSAIASLTIGSASAAVLLTHRDLSRTQNRLVCAAARARTGHHQLCCGDNDAAADRPAGILMETDSERLLQEGVVTGAATFRDFLPECGGRDALAKTFGHQVGGAHRKLMLETLDLPPARDFATYEWLGNTGSVALPTAVALGLEAGFVSAGERIGLLGIGSGINCLMLAVDWRETRVLGGTDATAGVAVGVC